LLVPAGQVWYLSREQPKLREKNEELLRAIQLMDMKIGVNTVLRRPLCAFVTFNTQEAVVKALEAYR